MKTIYEFSVKREVEQEVKKETDGGTLVTKEKVTKPIKLIFKRPNRAESEQADVVSAVEYSQSIRKGILTKPLLERFYDEKGGFLSEDYEAKYGKLLMKFYELQNEYTRITALEDKSLNNDQRLAEIATEFIKVQNDLQALDSARNSLFQNTAEVRAQNKTVFWLLLFLTYIQEDESKVATPFFSSTSTDFDEAFKEKRDDYDKKVEEGDDFTFLVIDKMSFFLGLWYLGRISTKEDFKSIEDRLNPPEEKQEEKKPEEPVAPTVDQDDKATDEGMPEAPEAPAAPAETPAEAVEVKNEAA